MTVSTPVRPSRHVRRRPCTGAEVTVGTGAGKSEKYPFNGEWDYSWSNVIYLQGELGAAGSITQLSFQVDSVSPGYTMTNQAIYIKHTPATGFFDTGYPGTAGYTRVFDGTVTYTGSGWKTISLDTPFAYDGASNLDILYESRDGSYKNVGEPVFLYTPGFPENRVRRDFEDGTFPSSCVECAMFPYVLNTMFHFCPTQP